MLTQLYAVAIEDDQSPGLGGLMTRQHGREADMRAFIGHFPGNNTQFYSSGLFNISQESGETFLDNMGAPLPGGIFRLVER